MSKRRNKTLNSKRNVEVSLGKEVISSLDREFEGSILKTLDNDGDKILALRKTVKVVPEKREKTSRIRKSRNQQSSIDQRQPLFSPSPYQQQNRHDNQAYDPQRGFTQLSVPQNLEQNGDSRPSYSHKICPRRSKYTTLISLGSIRSAEELISKTKMRKMMIKSTF